MLNHKCFFFLRFLQTRKAVDRLACDLYLAPNQERLPDLRVTMSSEGEGGHGDRGQRSIERKERVLSSQLPAQISSRRQTLARPDGDCPDSDSTDPKVQRSEVTVEMKGIRETTLSVSSESVVSSRIRTVYDRASSTSSSGGSPRTDRDSVSSLDDADDSAFSPGHGDVNEFIVGGVSGRTRRLSSDSYYISQTYQISSPSSPRAVSAVSGVGSPRFKSSRTISVGSEARPDNNEEWPQHSVDRKEGEPPGTTQRPLKVSTQEKKVHFTGLEEAQEPDDTLSEKMKSARETVQQMIESSYMVSDITDVIGETQLGSAEDSTSLLEAGAEATARKPQSCLSAASVTPQKNQLNSEIISPDNIPDRAISPVMAYSPGAAIRSYAMEELAERKCRSNTPDRPPAENATHKPVVTTPVSNPKRFRFGPESGLDLADEGSSVDAFVSELSVTTTSQPEVSASLQPTVLDTRLTSSCSISAPAATTEDEEAEALDKLVDLQSIQAGYRFHDVGMMLSPDSAIGGICNPAFDDSDSTDSPQGKSSEDKLLSKTPATEAKLFSPNAQFPGSLECKLNPSEKLTSPASSVEECRSFKETPIASQSLSPLAQPVMRTEQQQLLSAPRQDSPSLEKQEPSRSKNGIASLPNEQQYTPVSVSRRFNIRDKKLEAALKSQGAVLKSESVSYDVYYDTPDSALTLADCQLRSQNGQWQLSANFSKLFNTDTHAQFVDTEEDDARIVCFLREILASKAIPSSDAGNCGVSRFLHVCGLREFVRYSTTRRVYSLSSGQNGQLTVELVMPEYGFWHGHVTCSVGGVKEGLTEALTAIQTLWRTTEARGTYRGDESQLKGFEGVVLKPHST
ncbi:thiamine-triphosphatase [Elysia marginata]|uniref:Thiamine-triphosphatase n=1 Tax=Elysia marginata TaxID=1093978 RepID=A0AAV4G544_9GAST|nr:thiamine-triphosphatase [Elysia marginata]